MRGDPVFDFVFSDSHVISRDKNGNPVSVYGDLIWDFYPYRGPNENRYKKINFGLINPSSVMEAKYVMGIIIYENSARNTISLKVGTLQGYFQSLIKLSNFSSDRDLKLSDILCDFDLFGEFLRTHALLKDISSLSTILGMLLRVRNLAFGFSDITPLQKQLVSQIRTEKKPNEQFAVIPQRLLSNLIIELDLFFTDFIAHEDAIHAFIDLLTADKNYAVGTTVQLRNGISRPDFRANFPEAASTAGLVELFKKYTVKCRKTFSKFISSLQYAVQIYICIFSGMRRSEIQGLKIGCLTSEKNSKAVLVNGITTKPIPTSTNWVSIKDIIRPYDIAKRLALRIGKEYDQLGKQNMLFPSTVFLGFTSSRKNLEKNQDTLDSTRQPHEIFGYLNQNKLITTSKDHEFLERIDPFRGWSSDVRFQIDRPWRFTYHQFRRSLAYYISQSGLVSLQSLQRQYKHLCAEMTVYYCQSSGGNGRPKDFHNEFHKFLFQIKPEADAAVYIAKILENEKNIHGAESVRREVMLSVGSPITVSGRQELRKQFKSNQIAYSETPLGACLTRRKCSKRSILKLTSCIDCDSSVVNFSKLEMAISSQSQFLKTVSRNERDDFIYRSEKLELEGLVQLKNTIVEQN